MEEKFQENFLLGLEASLGESKNKYPTIPAIEVSIPHFQTS
jgi:hypothetical protein